tara:strand:- start:149 stop:724 length:576 start_codon:yes stop_codon:yes gene_type:complete
METKFKARGFSAVEFMMVILLSTVISTIMFTAVNESKVKAKNTAVVSQMLEYQKAFNFYFLDNGRYPSMNTDAKDIVCFGNGLVKGEGCIGIIAKPYDKKVVGQFEDQLDQYMSSLPRIEQSKGKYHYSSPAYSSCISTSEKPDHESNEQCGSAYYSLWFVLEGVGKDCAPADTAIRNLSGEYTLCRLQSI